MPQRDVHVGVVGPGAGASPADVLAAEEIGAALARSGAVVLTGGLGGVMAAAARGAAREGGRSVGLLPGSDRTHADPSFTVAIPTGLGELRNGLLVRASDALICVALSWGTLSEVALAVRTGVPVVSLGDLGLPLPGPLPAPTPAEAARAALAVAVSGPAGPGSSRRPHQDGGLSPEPPLAVPRIHHLTLTVTDVHRSAQWYQELLGPATVVPRHVPGWQRIRLQWPGGLVLVVTTHATTDPQDRFAHQRVGLDHVALACADESEVRAWAGRLDAIGALRGPVEDAAYAWAVTGRDPDSIPVEFFAPK